MLNKFSGRMDLVGSGGLKVLPAAPQFTVLGLGACCDNLQLCGLARSCAQAFGAVRRKRRGGAAAYRGVGATLVGLHPKAP
jgi:hypothetical protein